MSYQFAMLPPSPPETPSAVDASTHLSHNAVTADSSTNHLGSEQGGVASAKSLLSTLWRSKDKCHQISFRDPRTGSFRNQPVADIDSAIRLVQEHLNKKEDVYFACAEYKSSESRKENNADGAYAFWFDVDCGEDKATSGKGYRTIEEGIKALKAFCQRSGLPYPTHIVISGNGLHVYWVLTERLGTQLWKVLATKFKELAKQLQFRADPSRTADIASVLRVPGTLNYKYSPPRPVETISSSDELIELEAMLDAIDAATVTMPVVAHEQVVNASATKPVQTRAPMVPEPFEEDIDRDPPNQRKLASALKALSPDCDERTWKFHGVAPMAYEARYFPALHDELYKLARDWSSGDLGGVPSIKWNEPGSNGLSGKQCFDRVWRRFLKDTYTGKRPSLGTIFWRAKQTGWEFSNDFGGDAGNNDKAVS